MNGVFNSRPSRFLKPGRSLLLLMLFVFCTAAFATPTTPTSDFIDNSDGTVTHKLTGLVWMRCSMGQTWDKATASCTGTAATYTWDAAMALKSNFAGKNDWRLPNIVELQTIVERWSIPVINTIVFPNTPGGAAWSSSTYVSSSYAAWTMGIDNWYASRDNKNYSHVVRLVRGGQWRFDSLPLTTPTTDFTDNNDGTVTHNRTGLIWQRCTLGQTWTGSTCSGTPSRVTYSTIITLKSNFAGKSDWRVPNHNELLSIVEYGNFVPAINTSIFPSSPNGMFFSSSSSPSYTDNSWLVNFSDGNYEPASSRYNYSNSVRLVRGQWDTAGSLPNLDITNPVCRYVAPIYSTTWQRMKVKNAPSCGAVLRYHTWSRVTFWENVIVTNYYQNRLANIDTSNQLFNARLELFDTGISLLNDVLDPDLKRVLSSEGYNSTVNILKSKGIVASLAAGKLPFKANTLKGRILNKAFKDKIIVEGGSKVLCNLFLDSAAAKSCSNAAVKITGCVTGLDWRDKAMCVKDGVFSYATVINNAVDIFDVIKITKNLNGYILINDYLEAYYARGETATPTDNAKLESEIRAFAQKETASSAVFGDYDMAFVKAGIMEGLNRTNLTALHNVQLVESLKAILNK